jgi:hypothetical protein
MHFQVLPAKLALCSANPALETIYQRFLNHTISDVSFQLQYNYTTAKILPKETLIKSLIPMK